MHFRLQADGEVDQRRAAVPEDKQWYDMTELASMWEVPVARVRLAAASLEAIKAIITRDKPGDRRIKQVKKDSIETLRVAVLGG